MKPRAFVVDIRERRVGSPATLGRAARNEEAADHDDAANRKRPEAGRVHFWECHVRRADLERNDEVAECRKCQRHDAEKDHDRAVHSAERIVTFWRHHAVGKRADEPAKPKPTIDMSGCRRMSLEKMLN